MKVYLGIDLGGTNIAAGIVDESYQIIARGKRKTRLPCDDGLIDDLAAAANEAAEAAGISLNDVPWIGVGCPGTINGSTGVVEYANNLYLNNFALREKLEKATGRPVLVENDANAAAYGEYKAGALKGADNAIAVTLGTGVGGGVIIHGQIYSGSNFAGGELGHMVIEEGGAPCTCGRRGCWEAYSSATGLIRMTREAMDAHPESLLHAVAASQGAVNGQTAFLAKEQGDPAGAAVVERYVHYLSVGVANLINLFYPQVIALSGGVANQGEALLAPLREAVAPQVYGGQYLDRHTRLVQCTLGYRAGVIGAAMAARQD